LNAVAAGTALRMRIYRPKPDIETKLREVDFDTSIYCPSCIDSDFESMENCDVIWKPKGFLSELLANYQHLINSNFIDKMMVYEGALLNGQIEIPSAYNPNTILTVKDELLIRQGNLWINDQVFLKNGTRIIGNSLGIPYKFKKVIQV